MTGNAPHEPVADGISSGSGSGDNNNNNNIQAIQAECTAMISLLRDLEKEEHDLHCQLEILAREALLCGFQNDVIEPPIPKKRKTKAQLLQAQQQQQKRQKRQREGAREAQSSSATGGTTTTG
mmetsp:Transcript_3880/g.10162  ORF Transcript_3880/g.10162 Transcript_3880/m.10162 type:complete len:123 (+) Transcript_3880:30-398(+)